jgi:hypothetical protein
MTKSISTILVMEVTLHMTHVHILSNATKNYCNTRIYQSRCKATPDVANDEGKFSVRCLAC